MLKAYAKIIIIISILSCPLKTTAQLTFPWQEIGIFSGASGYIGDLNPDKYLNFNSPLIGLVYKYNFNDRHSARASFTYAKIQADDKQSNKEWQKKRNLNFFSPIIELGFAYEVNFFEFNPAIYQGVFITPYVNLGISAFKFDPQTTLDGKVYHLRNYGTEGQGSKKYSLYNISIPIGLGVKFNLSQKFNLFSELSYRFTFTDYLDDVSTKYADIASDTPDGYIASNLADRSPELNFNRNPTGSQRGDPSKKDTYMFVIIGITINFGMAKCIGPL